MHRLRNQSMHFHTQQQVDYLNQQNEKIINKLMHIAKRRSSSFFKQEEPSMVYY
jgi:D-lyxose ketol-isomerase